ncbi:hypothetical protein XENOCAPTIV_010975 [Xenoophorus captivus]|uniref:Uncharacterized protein n=1 Tax=Xenoophorus captivus TaxID=1517983 RepID=A0ABV0QIF3_9TELE
MSRGSVAEHQFSDADESEGGEEDGDEVDDEDEDEDDYDGDSTPKTRSRSTSPQPYALPSMSITAVADTHGASYLSHQGAPDLLGQYSRPPLFGYFTTVPSIQITPQAPPTLCNRAEHHRGPERNKLLAPPSSSFMDEDLPIPSPDLSSRLSSPGLEASSCPSPSSASSSPSACHYLSAHRDLSPRAEHLSPRRDISPLRHISPKRDLGVGGYRRDLSPRRGHLSVLSPLSRPTSPGGRDLKRDLSPRGRHKGMIRPLSPRRGLYHQSGARGARTNHQMGALAQGDFPLGRRSASAEMETVRSPFPMIPIGGIQMVHSIPTSSTTPLAQQGAPTAASLLFLQKSTSEDSVSSEVASVTEGGRQGGEKVPGGGVRQEQEESIHTCTKAIASLCLDPECVERGMGGGRSPSSSSVLSPDSQQQQQRCTSAPPTSRPSPSPPNAPGIQHFSGLELRPSPPVIPASPHSSSSSPSPHPPSPGSDSLQPPGVFKSVMVEKEQEAKTTGRKKDAS